MNEHSPMSVLIIDDASRENVRYLEAYFREIPHLHLDNRPRLPGDLSGWDVVLTALGTLSGTDTDRLTAFVEAGGGWLHCIPANAGQVPTVFGAQPASAGAFCELRILFNRRDHPLAARLPDAFYVDEHYHPLELQVDDTEMILYADWHYKHSAVLTERPHGDGTAACTTLLAFKHPVLRQIIYRFVRRMGGRYRAERRLGVGILGYAPSVGRYHGEGIAATSGLTLKSVCDLSPERLQQASEDFEDIKTFDSAAALARDPSVDLVIIATPPNTHATLALKMMDAGKHVVCEKPLALNRSETDTLAEAAEQQGVHLSCHQNRRWDVDYLAIKQALEGGLIGDLFYMETFVGGYSHPCGFWHSEAAVSGGTAFDWGGHYIDWIVSLCKAPVEAVIGTRHKRVWHDVTNADQERIQIRFSNGCEAEFMHSDIAAIRKPKWYLLGSRGAITGHWRNVTEYQIDALHYFQRHDIPATEMPPDLTVHRYHGSGKITTLKPAMPDRPIFGFHRNLADHLLIGEPLTAPLDDSIRVVAILDAAARSMANGGRLEALDA